MSINSNEIFSKHPVNWSQQSLYFKKLNYIQYKDGIPFTNFKQRFGKGDDEIFCYPITILINEINEIECGRNSQERTNKIIDLVAPGKDKSKTVIEKDFPTYKIKAPWKSALAQGFYLSYCLRNKFVTSDFCNTVCKMLLTTRQEGGYLDNNSLWFEEYPLNNKNSMVLNGHIISLISVIEYSLINNGENKEFLEKAVKQIEEDIQNYDNDGWSIYCLHKKNVANPDYHSLHIDLLKYLVEMNSNKLSLDKIEHYLTMWEKNLKKYNIDHLFKFKVILQRYFFGLMNRVKGIS